MPGNDAARESMLKVVASGAQIEHRRISKEDVNSLHGEVRRWYVCTGTAQRNIILPWLEGQEVLYEDYNF
ncbi:hypothetical protein BDZ85DRAFT_262221 [Elsinoe ampelina]|uniref:Uncharacterized protein n=1 Tax=Elsinoe ampelina TaxID=302913 RepID=A0A6A6GDU7_9PEZI|nr:hypothetical protein BDZ85DRAFT_262221 [Elsinoe ampelina]